MTLARVVSFDGVTKDRIEELGSQISDGGPPEGLPAKEIIVLHDAEAEKSLSRSAPGASPACGACGSNELCRAGACDRPYPVKRSVRPALGRCTSLDWRRCGRDVAAESTRSRRARPPRSPPSGRNRRQHGGSRAEVSLDRSHALGRDAGSRHPLRARKPPRALALELVLLELRPLARARRASENVTLLGP